ncbi:hypothetical protein JCM11491_004852 [Sporobolomyces phaffii]
MLSPLSTLSILSLAASFVHGRPTPAASAEFDDVLLLSPRDLVPAYVDKRDVPDYASPRHLRQNIAYFPAIESPEQGSVWTAGQALTVAWNNTKPDYAPNQIHNYASLLLGFRNPDDPSSGLNLDVDHPLANVSLYGSEDPIYVTLPSDLPTRSTYLLVLGSTANMSPLFTINGVDSESSSSVSSSGSSSAAALATHTAVASTPSSTSEAEQPRASTTAETPSPLSSATASKAAATAEAGGAQVATRSQVESGSAPSPTAGAATSDAAPSSVSPAASSSSPSSSVTRDAATPVNASGGALAASSSTPTSGAGSLRSSSIAGGLAGIVALAFMI